MRWFLIALWLAAAAMLGVGLTLIITRHSSNSQTTTYSTVRNPHTKHLTIPTLNIYQVLGGKLQVTSAALRDLPPDATTALKLLRDPGSVTVSNGTAQVTPTRPLDDKRRAEIVWTLTQFPSVKRVNLPGHKGLTRESEASFAPPIMIESPNGPNALPQTFQVKGTASVFEGTLVIEVQRGATVIARKTVTASAGAPNLGTFDAVLHVNITGPAQLVAYAPSAANGKPQHEVSVHIGFAH
jgi:hypothetical protein